MARNKILTFSDIHFGINLNSVLKLEIAAKTIDFIIEQQKSTGANICIFNGDWFNDRKTVNSLVCNSSYQKLKELCEVFDHTYLIVGNHDSYYQDVIDVNSLNVFENLDKCTIVTDITEITLDGCRMCLCPWGKEFDVFNSNTKYDALFGHFGPNGARLTSGLSKDGKYDINKLTSVAPIVFSGHFHIKSEYETNNGTLIMVGSPMQQNWGDVDSERGCYIFEPATRKYSFIENTKAPKHKKFLYSTISTTKKLPRKSDIENNYIRLVVDTEYEHDIVQKILSMFWKAKPIDCDTEYFFNNNIKLNFNNSDIDDTKNRTHEDYLIDFIKNAEGIPENLDRDKLQKLVLSIYKNALTVSKEIEE